MKENYPICYVIIKKFMSKNKFRKIQTKPVSRKGWNI